MELNETNVKIITWDEAQKILSEDEKVVREASKNMEEALKKYHHDVALIAKTFGEDLSERVKTLLDDLKTQYDETSKKVKRELDRIGDQARDLADRIKKKFGTKWGTVTCVVLSACVAYLAGCIIHGIIHIF